MSFPGSRSLLLGDSILTPDILSTAVAGFGGVFREAAAQAGPGAVRALRGIQDPRAAAEFFGHVAAEFERQALQRLHINRVPLGQNTKHLLHAPPQVAPSIGFARAVHQSSAGIITNSRDDPWDYPRTEEERKSHQERLESVITAVSPFEQETGSGNSAAPSGPRTARERCWVEGCPKYGKKSWRLRCVDTLLPRH